MGVLGKRGVGKRGGGKPITEKDVIRILSGTFMSKNNKRYEMDNLYVYKWESDYLFFTKSDYAYECEVKVSRQDFFNDKNKKEKHLILEDKAEGMKPNYFYYAVPEGLIKEDEVPEYAGLIYVKFYSNAHEYGYSYVVKEAPKINPNKQDIDKLNLIDKFYYNFIDWKRKADESNVNELKKQIKTMNENIMFYDERLSELTMENDELKRNLEKYEKNILQD